MFLCVRVRARVYVDVSVRAHTGAMIKTSSNETVTGSGYGIQWPQDVATPHFEITEY